MWFKKHLCGSYVVKPDTLYSFAKQRLLLLLEGFVPHHQALALGIRSDLLVGGPTGHSVFFYMAEVDDVAIAVLFKKVVGQ